MIAIKRINLHNIKSVSDFDIELNGATVLLTGGNNKGKSTILKSIIERIRGEKPELVLREGEEEGFGLMELTDGSKFYWDVKSGGFDQLTYVTSDGIRESATVHIRNKYFPKVFDIDKFLNKPPKEQLADLFKVTGLNTKIDIIDAEYKEAFEFRAIRRKVKDEEQAKVGVIDHSLPEKEYPTQALIEEISTIDLHNKSVNSATMQLDADKQELEELEEKMIRLKAKIKNGEEFLSNTRIKDNKETLELKLKKLNEDNELIRQNNKNVDQNQRYKEAVKEFEEAENILEECAARRKGLLDSAPLPEGFTMDEGKLLYNGLPLDRASQSSSALYIAGIKLAKEMLGEVKALHFDASFLDKNSLNEIWKWSKKEGLQLMIERPDYDGGEIKYEFIGK